MREIWHSLFSRGKNISLEEKGKNIIFAWGLALLWVAIISFIFGKEGMNINQFLFNIHREQSFLSRVFQTCFFTPLWEELVYRLAPITLLNFFKIKGKNFWMIILAISAIFGWGHGGMYNVYVQGFIGLMCAWVYVKNNNSYLSAVGLHSLWNFGLLWILEQLV